MSDFDFFDDTPFTDGPPDGSFGDEEWQSTTNELIKDLNDAIDNGLRRGVEYAAVLATSSLKPLAGPSAPGMPPNTKTGLLRASITTRQVTYAESWAYGTNVGYAKFLEFGTRKMAARPFLFPVMTNSKDQINKVVYESTQKRLRGMFG